LGEEDNSHLRVVLHQLGRGFTNGEMTIGISATDVRDIQNDPLFRKRNAFFESTYKRPFSDMKSHVYRRFQGTNFTSPLVCPSSSTYGVDMGKKPALVVASDADEYAGGVLHMVR
ncbi:hypothetical protein A2U01_0047951, partial [Trifolium medium]|nr:hypothetical protein [Trifolium medium]